MKYISSLQNPEIKDLVSLQTLKGRIKLKKCLFQGLRTMQTGLDSNLKLDKIYVTERNLAKISHLALPEKVIIISDQIAQKISTAKEASGLIATFFIPDSLPINDLASGLVLAQISDPGNMGTLIRTAAACNIKNVVVIEGVNPWSPKVIQSSAGTIGYVNIFNLSWPELILAKKNLKLCALVVKGGVSIKNINHHDSLLVVGNEAHGLSVEWQQDCDYLVTLPMPGNTESLNAAVAGSIALYMMHVNF